MESIVVVHFDDSGVMAFTEEAFKEHEETYGFEGAKYYEYWFDKKVAKKKYTWIV